MDGHGRLLSLTNRSGNATKATPQRAWPRIISHTLDHRESSVVDATDDAADNRRTTNPGQGGGGDVLEPEGELRRDVLVRADVPVQPVARSRRDVRLLPRHAGVQ